MRSLTIALAAAVLALEASAASVGSSAAHRCQAEIEEVEAVSERGRLAEISRLRTELRIAELEAENADLNAELAALRANLAAARVEIEEHIAKEEQLTKMLVKLQTAAHGATFAAGDKGRVILVDNEISTAVLQLNDEALTELLGPERNKPLPLLELSVKRVGVDGTPEFIGKVRLCQFVKGKNYVIADLLEDWQQMDFRIGDIVFAE